MAIKKDDKNIRTTKRIGREKSEEEKKKTAVDEKKNNDVAINSLHLMT